MGNNCFFCYVAQALHLHSTVLNFRSSHSVKACKLFLPILCSVILVSQASQIRSTSRRRERREVGKYSLTSSAHGKMRLACETTQNMIDY